MQKNPQMRTGSTLLMYPYRLSIFFILQTLLYIPFYKVPAAFFRPYEVCKSYAIKLFSQSGYIHGQRIIIDEFAVLPAFVHDFFAFCNTALFSEQAVHN